MTGDPTLERWYSFPSRLLAELSLKHVEAGLVQATAPRPMKAAKPRQVGAWIVLAILVAFLCSAIAFMYVGWGPGEGETGQ